MAAPRFTGFSIATPNPSASLDFYRAMGFAVKEDSHGGGRSCVDAPNQHFDVDDLARISDWNTGFDGRPGVGLGFEVDTRAEVDALADRLAALGYRIQQPPYDAPWGKRFTVIEDPDGTSIGVMSAD